MRSSLLALAASSALLASVDASAACSGVYTTDQLLADMMAAEDGLRSGDGDAVQRAGGSLESGLACMNEVLPTIMVGRTYRAIGAGKLLGDDEGKARQWFATAVEVDPQFVYGLEDLPEDHVVREVYQDLKIAYVPPAEAVADRTLSTGTHYLDGRRLSTPEAVGSRPHLYQLDNGAVQSWLIIGNAFPDVALVDPNAVADTGGKKPKKDKTSTTSPAAPPGMAVNQFGYIERQRPPEKTPLLVGGVVVMLGAGALYGYTMVTEGKFAGASSEEDVQKYAKLTNQLILASGGVAAVGAAAFTWGVMVDQKAGPMPTFTVRF